MTLSILAILIACACKLAQAIISRSALDIGAWIAFSLAALLWLLAGR